MKTEIFRGNCSKWKLRTNQQVVDYSVRVNENNQRKITKKSKFQLIVFFFPFFHLLRIWSEKFCVKKSGKGAEREFSLDKWSHRGQINSRGLLSFTEAYKGRGKMDTPIVRWDFCSSMFTKRKWIMNMQCKVTKIAKELRLRKSVESVIIVIEKNKKKDRDSEVLKSNSNCCIHSTRTTSYAQLHKLNFQHLFS